MLFKIGFFTKIIVVLKASTSDASLDLVVMKLLAASDCSMVLRHLKVRFISDFMLKVSG